MVPGSFLPHTLVVVNKAVKKLEKKYRTEIKSWEIDDWGFYTVFFPKLNWD